MIDAFLGNGANLQNACGNSSASPSTYAGYADCMTIGSSNVVTGSPGTAVIVNDTNAAGPGTLNLTGTVVVDAASLGTNGAASNFFLSGPNVVNTPNGPAIHKGFVDT